MDARRSRDSLSVVCMGSALRAAKDSGCMWGDNTVYGHCHFGVHVHGFCISTGTAQHLLLRNVLWIHSTDI